MTRCHKIINHKRCRRKTKSKYCWQHSQKGGGTNISGPINLSIHNNIYGKNIHIFGDTHNSKDHSCKKEHITIVDYLSTLFQNTKVPIDFYLETYFYLDTNDIIPHSVNDIDIISNKVLNSIFKYENMYLTDIRNKFNDYFKADSNNTHKRMPLVTFNSIDIRQFLYRSNQTIYLQSIWLIVFDKFIYYIDKIKKSKKIDLAVRNLFKPSKEFRQMIMRYVGQPSNVWFTAFKTKYPDLDYTNAYEQYINNNKITEALSTVINEKIKNQLINYYNYKVKLLLDEYEKTYNMYIKLTDIDLFLYMFSKNAIFFVILNALYMDLYTLAKIFSNTIPEVWIYCGDAHSQNYRDFIVNYLNETKYTMIKGDKDHIRCIKI